MTHSSPGSETLLRCPFCQQAVQFRKALHISDGNVDSIIHAATSSCPMVVFEDGSVDESILSKWNARAPAQSPPVPASEPMMFAGGGDGSFDENDEPPTQSSPALSHVSQASGEIQPSDLDRGPGEAVFAECAEIALEHEGAEGPTWSGYDRACRDIAAAIKTRASNRKVMDALAPAAPQAAQRALAALEKAREYVASFLYTAGSHAYLKQCNLLIEIDAALSRPVSKPAEKTDGSQS